MLETQAFYYLDLVKRELKIDLISKSFDIASFNPSFDPLSPLETPILDALSCKLGFSLNFLCPPTKTCLLCAKTLTYHNDPNQVPLHNLDGPKLVTKFIWRCKNCTAMWKLLSQKERSNDLISYEKGDVAYHPDMYGSPSHQKFYPKSLPCYVVRASNEVFFTSLSLEAYFSEFHHGWLSAETKAKSYNETHRGSKNCKRIDIFTSFHPKKMAHFNKKSDKDELVVENEENYDDENFNDKSSKSRNWEMKKNP